MVDETVDKEEQELADTPMNINVKHVRAKLGWARRAQLDKFVKINGIGETMSFEQLKGVLDNVGIGKETDVRQPVSIR